MIDMFSYYISRSWIFHSIRTLLTLLLLLSTVGLTVTGCAQIPAVDSQPRHEFITLATTTSTYDSGLLDELLPVFTAKTGIEVRVISMGTGQALETGKRGDADVLLVHDRHSELQLVEEGYFTDRKDVMHNDFILVGPPEDPAGVKSVISILDAFEKIAKTETGFASRGDDSGTHRLELFLWEQAGVGAFSNWYFSLGQGMGDTLIVADDMLNYALTDRGTYLAMRDKLDLVIILESDPLLFNQYGIMMVNPEVHGYVKYESALKLINFFMSPQGQELIEGFQIDGESLFFPGMGLDK